MASRPAHRALDEESPRRDARGLVVWPYPRASGLAAAHLLVGGGTLLAFLATGAYMRLRDPAVGALEPGRHVMLTSRHIYILAAALLHLVLGSHLRAATTSGPSVAQRAGTLLLVLASALLIAAFVYEPVAGRYATAFSRFGLYSLFVGLSGGS